MTTLTTLNITGKNANNSLSVTVKVNITKKKECLPLLYQKKTWIRFILMGSNYLQTG